MTDDGFGLVFVGVAVGFLIGLLSLPGCAKAYWQKGVQEGYGAATDPADPEYRKAREHLKQVNRWYTNWFPEEEEL